MAKRRRGAGYRPHDPGYATALAAFAPKIRAEEAMAALSSDDRAWLEERLEEYAELLEYLHDH